MAGSRAEVQKRGPPAEQPGAGSERGDQSGLHVRLDLSRNEPPTRARVGLLQRRHSMIRGDQQREGDRLLQPRQPLTERAIRARQMVDILPRVRAKHVTRAIGAGDGKRQQIGRRVTAELVRVDRRRRQVHQILAEHRRTGEHGVGRADAREAVWKRRAEAVQIPLTGSRIRTEPRQVVALRQGQPGRQERADRVLCLVRPEPRG
jgi:hypothetical protein